MNIFIFDDDIINNVIAYPDKYVNKMLIETAQILSTTLRSNGYNSDNIYKSTHINHPSVKWCCESWNNFLWLCELGNKLFDEFKYRYKKSHKSWVVIYNCRSIYLNDITQKIENPNIYHDGLNINKHTPFIYVGPEKYKLDNVINSYRNYFINEKRHIAKWKNRSIPVWFN